MLLNYVLVLYIFWLLRIYSAKASLKQIYKQYTESPFKCVPLSVYFHIIELCELLEIISTLAFLFYSKNPSVLKVMPVFYVGL